MQEYQNVNNPVKCSPIDTISPRAENPFPPASLEVGGKGAAVCGAPLVNRCISQTGNRNPVPLVERYAVGIKMFRAFTGTAPKGGKRGAVSSFSNGSKRRLRWSASNALPALISQFGMTYHNRTPDGFMVKRHLNAFLTLLRKRFGAVGYLWILEFQSRGTPHFHLWLTLPQDTDDLHAFMAEAWHRIAEPESADHLWFHQRPENFIPWSMGSGSYLCKYLDKAAQKAVPDGFNGVGRFWGASRGLVPPPDVLEASEVEDWTGLIRTVCRHHEKTLRRSKWKSRARRSCCSFRLPNGAIIVNQLLKEERK